MSRAGLFVQKEHDEQALVSEIMIIHLFYVKSRVVCLEGAR